MRATASFNIDHWWSSNKGELGWDCFFVFKTQSFIAINWYILSLANDLEPVPSRSLLSIAQSGCSVRVVHSRFASPRRHVVVALLPLLEWVTWQGRGKKLMTNKYKVKASKSGKVVKFQILAVGRKGTTGDNYNNIDEDGFKIFKWEILRTECERNPTDLTVGAI